MNRNIYQPIPLEDKEAERVLNKIKKYSIFQFSLIYMNLSSYIALSPPIYLYLVRAAISIALPT